MARNDLKLGGITPWLFSQCVQHTAASKRPEMRLIDDADTSILPTVAALDMRLGTLRSAL